jgi:hypothetical protein
MQWRIARGGAVDIVLGVSMVSSTVRTVALEGENADGVTVDQDGFTVDPAGSDACDRVIEAILRARQRASERGYRLASTGVAFGSQAHAVALREALADRDIDDVMLVSALLAAAAQARAVGDSTGYAKTGLLFIEPDAATLAVVDTGDGSLSQIQGRLLSSDDDTAVAELAGLIARAEMLEPPPDGVLVLGSQVNIALIRPALEAATALPVSVPAQPEAALATGAALASAHAPLFSSSTSALAWAQDPGSGAVDSAVANSGYVYFPAERVDHEATFGAEPRAYSALQGQTDSVYPPGAPAYGAVSDDDPRLVDSRLLDFSTAQPQAGRKPFMLAGSALAALFVVGVAALVFSLVFDLRSEREPGRNMVIPTKQIPGPPRAHPVPAPQPRPAPSPAPASVPQAVPPAQAPAPARTAPQAPAPVYVPAPAPAPPPAPPAMPPIAPWILVPRLPDGPPGFPESPRHHGDDDDDHEHGERPKIPLPIPIPGIPGLGF